MKSLLVLLLLTPAARPQDPAPEPAPAQEPKVQLDEQTAELLRVAVLRQDDRTWTAREVVDRLAAADSSLWPAMAPNPEYTRLYLASPRFYDQVRWFSNLMLLDAADVISVDEETLLAEARAWSKDRGRDAQQANAMRAANPFEIEARARLIALQPTEFEDNQVRAHFHRSVAEFYGRLKLSWIALPLFDMESGAALGETERLARYGLLNEVAAKLGAEELEWEAAVQTYDEDPRNNEENGLIGWVARTEVDRYEYPLLREVFSDLGFTAPQGMVLRGPIIGQRWVYLVRIESVRTKGVVEFQRVRTRVERSMREDVLLGHLQTLGENVERSILLPPTE